MNTQYVSLDCLDFLCSGKFKSASPQDEIKKKKKSKHESLYL